MRWALITLLAGASFALQASPAQAAPAKKKHSSATLTHSSLPTRQSSLTTTHSSPRSRKGKLTHLRAVHTPPAPTYQLHPDPERYQQIQQALADRGYYKGQVNGEWNDDSTDALKRFQADQKLPDDGKISSLALIGLGLGARHDGTTAATVPALSADPTASSIAPPPPVTEPLPPH